MPFFTAITKDDEPAAAGVPRILPSGVTLRPFSEGALKVEFPVPPPSGINSEYGTATYPAGILSNFVPGETAGGAALADAPPVGAAVVELLDAGGGDTV